MINKQDQINEAIFRLTELGIHPAIISEFQSNDRLLYYSDNWTLYELNNDDWKKEIAKFETEYNAVVYHAVYSRTSFGTMLSLLFISQYDEEWPFEHDLLKRNIIQTYTINFDIPEYSEIGTIEIKPMRGALKRII